MVAWGWRGGGALPAKGEGVSLWDDENVLKSNGGEGLTSP